MGASPPPDVSVREDSMFVSIPGTELTANVASRDRYWKWWATQDLPIEFLLPHIDRPIVRTWPSFMFERRGLAHLSGGELRSRIAELGPWYTPYPIGDTWTMNMEMEAGRRAASRILFRRELIGSTVAALLGTEIRESTVLDIGCNSGFFSLDLADRGAKHVDGFDLRAESIAQARFVAEYYSVTNVAFDVSDFDTYGTSGQWDVVLNLGVLYHVTNPLQFVRRTYELCRRFAIIDTTCSLEPFAGYALIGDKDIDDPIMGRESWELHPTYRGAIDTIKYAGFREVVEIRGTADPPHLFYEVGERRCFLAIK
jgi:tRNA (mo5U34)-methyltransferase